MKRLLIVPLLVFTSAVVYAQHTNMKPLPLEDMSQFKPQAGNWSVVGDVTMDPNVDIHPHEPAAQQETGKKKKKKKKNRQAPEPPKAVTFQPGKGVLLNMNTADKKSNLLTTWEHGDIELELEVMLPKGSNSGLYLQGRYEVQLYDSWGVKSAGFSDIGGIYRNWESDPAKSYMGKAPLLNAAKAPGLWQTMKISFRAPRFNGKGEKIANAKFVYVELNGVKIHDHVEVPKPTGGPVENNEKPTGPLMIQGDHGPVAFRNVRYRLLHDSEVSLTDISYKAFHGSFHAPADFVKTTPVRTGTTPQLTWEVAGTDDGFGVVYTGTLNIPEDGDYHFEMFCSGNASLAVNDKTLIGNRWGRSTGDISLNKGSYPFELVFHKNVSWQSPRLGLFVSGADTHPKALHSFNSLPPDADQVSPILINVGSEPRLLRAFLDFDGQRSRRLTHTVGVGGPAGIHYVYDLKAGNVACVWRGDFVNATPMWHDRGDGSFRPLGMVQYLFTDPALAMLGEANAPFPDKSKEGEFRSKGYVLDKATRLPVFKYIYKGIEVEDRTYPDAENKMFIREVSFKNVKEPGMYFKLAEGADVTTMPDGTYAIDGKKYYINVLSATKPSVREQGGRKELILPVDSNPVKYSIIW